MHRQNLKGALAHLARACDWQSQGDEFDSRMLHLRIMDAVFAAFFLWGFFTVASMVGGYLVGKNKGVLLGHLY